MPPSFIVPGQQLKCDVMDACDIPGGTVTVAPKGFMNANLILRQLEHFEHNLPALVK